MKLIETSVWVKFLRRRPHAVLQQQVSGLIGSGEAAINSIVRLELLLGTRDRRSFEGIADELSGVTDLTIVARTWDIAADLGYQLRRLGLPTAIPDLVIAASAIEHDIVLLHADSDFDRIAQHSDLRVESYVTT